MSVHRLFVALRPPQTIRQLLIAAMHGVANARWQDDDQLHLTLRFVGDVDRHGAEDIAAALGGVHADVIAARIAGVGMFEKRGVPHTLWAGVEPAESVAALHRKVGAALQRVGVEPDGRAFVPHITLARLNRSAGPIAPFIAQASDLRSAPFVFDQMILYESELGHGGSQYHPVARYPLAATSAAATALTSDQQAAKSSALP
jgi:RNA 2',3'-cyclic 3'-phosphodiesterase